MINLNPNTFLGAGIWRVTGIQAGPRKKKLIRNSQSETCRADKTRNNQPTNIMKPIKSFAVAMAGLAISAVTSHAQLTLNFASTAGSTIQFNGASSSFQFDTSILPSDTGTQWQIGSENGGTGSAINLFGVVDNSPFSYGPISTTIVGPYTFQTATVLGPFGGLKINDGLGNLLTGDINWVDVETVNFAGGINASLTVNVTDLAYAGSNPDLETLVAEGPGSMDLAFQFSPGKMLSQLTSGVGTYNTSFSGSISVVPEPGTFALMVCGLTGLLVMRRRSAMKSAG
jgi:hypothetical protein